MKVFKSNLLRNYFINSYAKHNFAEWVPKIPKHKVVIDRTSYRQPHAVWDVSDAEKTVEVTHVPAKDFRDRVALVLIKSIRCVFDFVTGYSPNKMNETLYLRRAIFLETLAGVPGMVGGMVRHLKALRYLREDGGWIHHLLEEAENERMHLLTFLSIRQPGILMKGMIMTSQLIFLIFYFSMYMTSPKTAHRFVGYLEEEAVKTYTGMIKQIDEGKLPQWQNLKIPEEPRKYYGLKENATMRDLIICIRADEVAHREYNHHFADVKQSEIIRGHKLVVMQGGEDIKELKKAEATSN